MRCQSPSSRSCAIVGSTPRDGTSLNAISPKLDSEQSAFVALFKDVCTDGEARDAATPVSFDFLRSLVQSNVEVLDDVTTASFVHWDLWNPNVFVDPASLEVTSVIDFERALWGDPLMEGQFFSKGDDAAFIDSYGRPMLNSEGARRQSLLYDLYLLRRHARRGFLSALPDGHD